MTRQADFKRRVRARMAKTGESYATARSRLLGRPSDTGPEGSPPGWMPGALHISNGDATDVPGTGFARRVIYWRDILHEGPVPDGADPAELNAVRARYLAEQGWTTEDEALRHFATRDERLPAATSITLWFDENLVNQLQLIQILAVLSTLDTLVLKPVDGSGGKGIVIGPAADEYTLDSLRATVAADPRGWIAQRPVALSTSPTLIGNEVAPRHIDLRPFAINDGNDVWLLPGGLTRVALPEGALVVNSSQGGGSKDTTPSAASTP